MRSAAILLVASGLASLLYAVAAKPLESAGGVNVQVQKGSKEEQSAFGSILGNKFGGQPETSHRSHEEGGDAVSGSKRQSEVKISGFKIDSENNQKHVDVKSNGSGERRKGLSGSERQSEVKISGFKIDSENNQKHVDVKSNGSGERRKGLSGSERQSEVKISGFKIDSGSNQKHVDVKSHSSEEGRDVISGRERHSEKKAFGFKVDSHTKERHVDSKPNSSEESREVSGRERHSERKIVGFEMDSDSNRKHGRSSYKGRHEAGIVGFEGERRLKGSCFNFRDHSKSNEKSHDGHYDSSEGSSEERRREGSYGIRINSKSIQTKNANGERLNVRRTSFESDSQGRGRGESQRRHKGGVITVVTRSKSSEEDLHGSNSRGTSSGRLVYGEEEGAVHFGREVGDGHRRSERVGFHDGRRHLETRNPVLSAIHGMA